MKINGIRKGPWYKSQWANGLLIFSILVITALLVLKTQEPRAILDLLGNLRPEFLVLTLLGMGIYMGLEAWMLHLLLDSVHKRQSPIMAIKSMFLGQYYSLITPFASGGQPMQLVALMREGISVRHGTAVLVNKFLCFQIGVTVYASTLAIFHFKEVWGLISGSFGMIGIGLIINMVGLTVLMGMIFFPKAMKIVHLRVQKIFKRLGFQPKGIKRRRRKWFVHIDEFTLSIRIMLRNRILMAKMVILTGIQLTAYFGMTYFIYRAFGFNSHTFIEIITLQSVFYLTISLLPTPGSVGVAEGGFYWFFGSIFTAGTMTGALLLWRGISYYLNLIVSGIATLLISLIHMHQDKRKQIAMSTMVLRSSLQKAS